MATNNKLISQVEDALATPKILDRDLVRDLLELAKALEVALISACRTNLELKAMDRNVAHASNQLRDAIDALNSAYTKTVAVQDGDVETLVDSQLKMAQAMLAAEKQATS